MLSLGNGNGVAIDLFRLYIILTCRGPKTCLWLSQRWYLAGDRKWSCNWFDCGCILFQLAAGQWHVDGQFNDVFSRQWKWHCNWLNLVAYHFNLPQINDMFMAKSTLIFISRNETDLQLIRLCLHLIFNLHRFAFSQTCQFASFFNGKADRIHSTGCKLFGVLVHASGTRGRQYFVFFNLSGMDEWFEFNHSRFSLATASLRLHCITAMRFTVSPCMCRSRRWIYW